MCPRKFVSKLLKEECWTFGTVIVHDLKNIREGNETLDFSDVSFFDLSCIGLRTEAGNRSRAASKNVGILFSRHGGTRTLDEGHGAGLGLGMSESGCRSSECGDEGKVSF